jgi:hypothetical protein
MAAVVRQKRRNSNVVITDDYPTTTAAGAAAKRTKVKHLQKEDAAAPPADEPAAKLLPSLEIAEHAISLAAKYEKQGGIAAFELDTSDAFQAMWKLMNDDNDDLTLDKARSWFMREVVNSILPVYFDGKFRLDHCVATEELNALSGRSSWLHEVRWYDDNDTKEEKKKEPKDVTELCQQVYRDIHRCSKSQLWTKLVQQYFPCMWKVLAVSYIQGRYTLRALVENRYKQFVLAANPRWNGDGITWTCQSPVFAIARKNLTGDQKKCEVAKMRAVRSSMKSAVHQCLRNMYANLFTHDTEFHDSMRSKCLARCLTCPRYRASKALHEREAALAWKRRQRFNHGDIVTLRVHYTVIMQKKEEEGGLIRRISSLCCCQDVPVMLLSGYNLDEKTLKSGIGYNEEKKTSSPVRPPFLFAPPRRYMSEHCPDAKKQGAGNPLVVRMHHYPPLQASMMRIECSEMQKREIEYLPPEMQQARIQASSKLVCASMLVAVGKLVHVPHVHSGTDIGFSMMFLYETLATTKKKRAGVAATASSSSDGDVTWNRTDQSFYPLDKQYGEWIVYQAEAEAAPKKKKSSDTSYKAYTTIAVDHIRVLCPTPLSPTIKLGPHLRSCGTSLAYAGHPGYIRGLIDYFKRGGREETTLSSSKQQALSHLGDIEPLIILIISYALDSAQSVPVV